MAEKWFLAFHTLLWGICAFLAGIGLCAVLFGEMRGHADFLISVTGYAAFFPGFLGGVLRMLRRGGKQEEEGE